MCSVVFEFFYRWLVSAHKSKLVMKHPTLGNMTAQIKVKVQPSKALNKTPSRIQFVVRSPAGTNPGGQEPLRHRRHKAARLFAYKNEDVVLPEAEQAKEQAERQRQQEQLKGALARILASY